MIRQSLVSVATFLQSHSFATKRNIEPSLSSLLTSFSCRFDQKFKWTAAYRNRKVARFVHRNQADHGQVVRERQEPDSGRERQAGQHRRPMRRHLRGRPDPLDRRCQLRARDTRRSQSDTQELRGRVLARRDPPAESNDGQQVSDVDAQLVDQRHKQRQ